MTIQKYSTSILPAPSYKIESKFKTLVSDFDDGSEQRNRQWRFPKRTVSMEYRALSQSNRDTLHEFFRERYGNYEPFWFIDFKSRSWDDEYVGYAGPAYLDGQYYLRGTSYIDQVDEAEDTTVDNVLLMPATNSTAGDCNYFGSNEPFDRVTITITTAGSHGSTGTWEYYSNTGGWVSLTLTTDQTDGFYCTTGSKNVDFTCSTKWQDYTVDNVNAYWVRWRITTTSSQNVQPKASQVLYNSKSFDLPCVLASSTDLIVYENGTSTSAYTISSGAGGGGADRINFTDYPSSGNLITADFTGNLRLRARMNEDNFPEEQPHPNLYNVAINIHEVR